MEAYEASLELEDPQTGRSRGLEEVASPPARPASRSLPSLRDFYALAEGQQAADSADADDAEYLPTASEDDTPPRVYA